jgi:hypothetical protein
MKTTTKSATLLALIGIGLFATASPAAADSVTSVGDGTLLAKGAAVSITYAYECDAGQTVATEIRLTQRVSQGRTATGRAIGSSFNITCTGFDTQTVSVRADSLAFKTGTAVATISLATCTTAGYCVQYPDFTQEIRIRK